MAKLFVVGDIHYKRNNIEETDLFEISLLNEIQSRLPLDGIVLLGDVVDKHENVNSQIRAVKLFNKLRRIAKLYIIIGNHDYKDNNQFLTDSHPFIAVKYWDDTILIDSVYQEVIKGSKLVFVPYVPPGRFKEALNTVDGWMDADCIFAHQEFVGANFGAIPSIEGDVWSKTYPNVISGHIHNYQTMGNILYLGTPIQNQYDDSQSKYVACVNIKSKDYEIELINLKDIIKKKIVHINANELDSYQPENDKMMLIKLKIKVRLEEATTLKKKPIYKELIRLGYKVVMIIENIDSPTTIINTENVKYSTLIRENLKAENLLELYDSLRYD